MVIECTSQKFTRPYRMSLSERQEVKMIISDLLQNKIIRPSTSPYASPILLVPKKYGGKRLCVISAL